MKLKKIVSLLFIIAVILITFYATHRFLKDYSIHQIISDLNKISLKKEIYALFLTVISYLLLTAYDFLGLQYLERKLSPLNVMFTSFISYAFSNSIGLSILASGSLRYRYYSFWGLSFSEITQIIIFTTTTLWVGILTVGGFAFCFGPGMDMNGHILSYLNMRFAGALFLTVVMAYMFLLLIRRKPVSIFNNVLPLPSFREGVLQVIVGGADWIFAGSVLYVLLPDQFQISFMTFIGIYLVAQTVGLISHVPGGVLVFEGVLLSFIPQAFIPQVIGSILVYRVVYYILPLLLAAFVIAMSEFYRNRHKLKGYYVYINKIYGTVIPDLIFFIVFIFGSYMFLKGALPVNPERFPFVREIFPLPLVESSHFLESLIGLFLVIISRGLRKRVDLAFQLTVILLIAGTVFGIIKGAEYETTILAAFVVAVMMPARKLFNRKSPFFTEIMTKEWIFSILVILCIFTWLGFFSYKHVEYKDSLWWTFTFKDNAPRFLRALMGSIVFVLGLIIYKFMLPSRKRIGEPQNTQELVRKIVSENSATYAYLAYLPDKSYVFSETGQSFIMYGAAGRSFISMGDPVGAEECMGDLIREFRSLAAQHGCNSAFYEISAKYIAQYIEAGFKIFKIGEEAKVNLSSFSLQGGHWSGTRNNIKKMEKNNCRVEIIQKKDYDRMMQELSSISNQWLENKNTREKGFSLGFFDKDYLANTQIAVVFCEDRPVAFANLWLSGNKEEMSVDLMRYGSDAPSGVMEYLFIQLMLMGKEQGYGHFNLGMAPLSGIDVHKYSPFWNRIASTIYNHGEMFYNFKGLWRYKEKFKPEWEPKYIAVPGFLSLPKTLTNIASLISGGAVGIFRK
jgi:phosphatidylglycerol lysyltransferase